MGWVHDVPEDDLYEHEGYPVAVLADGSEPEKLQFPVPHRDGVTTGNGAWWLYTGKEGRPLAVGVRSACQCGWRGTKVHPIDWTDHEATDGWEESTGPNLDWTRHIKSLLGTTFPSDLTEALDAVSRRITELASERPLVALQAVRRLEKLVEHHGVRAVARAREGAASWEEIGKPLEITRQAAQQRFGRYLAYPHLTN